jgi:ATP-binding cassette subfamily C protein CydCD
LETCAVLLLGILALGDVNAPLPDAVLARTRARSARRRLGEVLASAPPATDPIIPLRLPRGRDLRAHTLTAAWPASTTPRNPAPTPVREVIAAAAGVAAPAGPHDHPGADVLRGLDLDLPAGSRMAVRGRSGAGKSTLVAVLLRFLDPRDGTLTLGRRPTRALLGNDVRAVVGLVSDDEHVFATSVRENLRLARPGATDPDLVAALQRARLGPWLAGLPRGLDTWLGESGTRMSVGERRRLAITRALLADQPILILDEPAESLDEPTARAVLADVFAASGHRSVLLVTHRAEGLDQVDRVFRMENGRLTPDPVPGTGTGTGDPRDAALAPTAVKAMI